MKNIFNVSLLATAVVFTAGVSAATFKNENEKVSYAIGVSFSRYVESTLEKQAELGMELDKDVVIQGINDAVSGTAKLNDAELGEVLKAYGEKVQAAVQKKQAEDAKIQAAELAKRIVKEKAFLEENAKEKGVKVTASGLQYSVIKKGNGPKAAANNVVKVHYTGKLIDGTTFDSSVERGEPATFKLNQVIAGWTEGVQLMSAGAKYKFVIPAELAYGEQGGGPVPPGATLIFEVELLEILFDVTE